MIDIKEGFVPKRKGISIVKRSERRSKRVHKEAVAKRDILDHQSHHR